MRSNATRQFLAELHVLANPFLASASFVFQIVFSLLGTAVTVLELVAFVLAVGCVVLSVVQSHWTWPLSIASSLLYGWLFLESGLFGEAMLQLLFVALSIWGWWQWKLAPIKKTTKNGTPVRKTQVSFESNGASRRLGWRASCWAILAWGCLWPGAGLLLANATQSDVPYFDALATSGSVVAQVMLAKKCIENWLFWIVVNVVSVLLFMHKGLMLTAMLYALFASLAIVGWLRWRMVPAVPLR